MDDDFKDYRRSKPQQKLYKPGSGPLKRSSYSSDVRMDTYNGDNGARGRENSHYGSHQSVSDIDTFKQANSTTNRNKKPEQQLYVPKAAELSADNDRHSKSSTRDNTSQHQYNRKASSKHDRSGYNSNTSSYSRGPRRDRSYGDQRKDGRNSEVNHSRQYRQVSETRSISPSQAVLERNRDSRSMETSAGRHMQGAGGKPPSGRRNSAGYPSDTPRPKYMINFENLPPRLRKKYLEEAGHHSVDNVDQINRDQPKNYPTHSSYNQGQFYNSNPCWSQTLPSRGRGRLKDNQSFDRDKFLNSYMKNYEMNNSRQSTPSNSYMNLYEPDTLNNGSINQKPSSEFGSPNSLYDSEAHNGINNDKDYQNKDSVEQHDTSETISQISSNLIDMTLDWTEEVEKNIKLDETCDSSTTSYNTSTLKPADVNHFEVKPSENRESKRSGSRRSRHKDRRSSSRTKNADKKSEHNRRDSNTSIPYETLNRRDSNVSIQHEAVSSSLKQRDRERRDSHRSNRSSTLGNSRDDLDRWRSLRSYSREHSTEGRIVSQCNSRDTSASRALSPRDNDGFRVPTAVSKSTWSVSNQKKSNGSTSGRTPSIDRGRQSPAIERPLGEAGVDAHITHGGGGRKSRKNRRNKARNAEPAHPPAPQPSHTVQTTTNNWREEILESKKMHDKSDNTHQRKRLNSAMSDKSGSETTNAHPGILILPQCSKKEQTRAGSIENQKMLFDPQNPSKPIIVQSPSKVDTRMERGKECFRGTHEAGEAGEAGAARHRALLQEVDRADAIMQTQMLGGPVALANNWPNVTEIRKFLQNSLQKLLMSDLKYCQSCNVEHYFWKILYYRFIEILRESFPRLTPEDKPKVVKLINMIIEEGIVFYENLVHLLESAYKFNTDDYLNDNHILPPKGLGFVGLALISVQKVYVFLGDLARYKEQVNESNNYAKSKFWYTKAQQINPKNGRPYNQLAILAVYARRKLDAVYYYMRSLMSSNPFNSARESLISIFDENRKKYEAAERKRRAALESSKPENGDENVTKTGQGLRREVWVRPSGHRTTTLQADTRDEHLANMTPVELNKIFITSYLHVHGKLITKIGMESFHECASQMLRQFRALLHRQPLPTPSARLLQLTALNMFAVETTAAPLKDNKESERSAWLECALGVSLLMFGAMLERCCALLPEPAGTQHHTDAMLLLPAIKMWSDWMLCHSRVWNPPPSFHNFELENENDPWDWLAKLMNILESCDDKSIQLHSEAVEGGVLIRLPEDASLAGFTPLMYMEAALAWLQPEPPVPYHAAEHCLRSRKLLFFGTEYLVGVEPPVLRLEYSGASPRYVSAVERKVIMDTQKHVVLSEDSDDEDSVSPGSGAAGALAGGGAGGPGGAGGHDEATRRLLRRKEQLESRKATLERRKQRMQEILRGSRVRAEAEVRPRWLVPDTNCFIDHLRLLQAVAAMPDTPYVLAVPLVVVTELEGLSKCARVDAAARSSLSWIQSAGGSVRLATARGSLLASRAFTAERDEPRANNDDRVLATALNLQANMDTENDTTDLQPGGQKRVLRVREVVLLTDDRNLRVKAMAAELPARDLPSFIQWAGLEQDDSKKQAPSASSSANDATSGRQ